jgi:PKD repeat protein
VASVEVVSDGVSSSGATTSLTWDFGDGNTATAKNVTHSWNAPGAYTVKLTVENDDASASSTKVYTVNGARIQQLSAVVVPWIARADEDKALPQSSDLDIHNPGSEALKVNLIFRRRGLPEPDPPEVERTVAPGATLHVPDAMSDLFNRPNQSGFLFVEPMEGNAQPVVTSTNHTFREDGSSFGQVVPGIPIDVTTKAETPGATNHLVGMNANAERLAYFGISNPNDAPFFYNLRFYNSLGQVVAQTSEPSGIARFGQKQYQDSELLDDFGIDNLDDYRIEIVPEPGGPRPLVYGANLRRASFDPSFVRPGRTDTSVVYLVGALNTPGLNDSFFRSDVVLGNTASETVLCELTFQGAGLRTEATSPITETLQPGESVRLVDAVGEWSVGNTVGAMRVACEAPAGVFPVVQGESYDVSNPDAFYGQFMPALTEADSATAGESQTLVGLRKDASHRTTLWLFNPGDGVAQFDLRYFDADGTQIGSEIGARLGGGKFRQINPEAHPIPDQVPGGFVVRVEVKSGKLLSAGQVVNQTNDPAYIVGR